MSFVVTLFLTVVSSMLAQSSTTSETSEPLQAELREEVEVRFIIVDALVLDSHGSLVTGLQLDDFELSIDLQLHPIVSVDLECPKGTADEPRAVRFGERRMATPIEGTPRRIVLVVDYKNLPQTLRVEVLGRLKQMVRDLHGSNEELMVVAITDRLRVEQRFTDDPEPVQQALDRMEHDLSLWQQHANPHYAEFSLFDSLTALTRLLSRYEGSKALVLFSDLPTKIPDAPFSRPLHSTPAAFDYDRQFQTIASSATNARVAIYPVHSNGLTLGSSSHRLARLAVDTGGRFTENTNDLSWAYARAQRDLACRYAVGFRDKKPSQDRVHRLNLRVPGRGFRVIHPVHYRFGSSDEAQESLAETAYTAPIVFPGQTVAGQVIAVRPLPGNRWQAVVAMRFPVSIPRTGENVVKFGAKLDDHARRAVHATDHELIVQADARGGEQPIVTLTSIDIAPGSYELSIVIDDPEAEGPQSFVESVELPRLPRKGLYVVDPILMRAKREDVIVHWNEENSSLNGDRGLEPTVGEDPVSAAQLTAVTNVCWLRSVPRNVELKVSRSVLRADDAGVVTTFEPVRLSFSKAVSTSCQALHDEFSTRSLDPGSYEFEVTVLAAHDIEPLGRRSPFILAPR